MPNKTGEIKKKVKFSRWFRMYADIIDDSKVQRLCSSLFKTWVNILALASNADGKVPHADEVAFRLRMSPKDAGDALDELIHLGLIDILPDGSRTPHNWAGRQFKWDGQDPTAADRMRRMRKRQSRSRYGRVTVDVTEKRSESVSVVTEGNTSARNALWPSTARETPPKIHPRKNLAGREVLS